MPKRSVRSRWSRKKRSRGYGNQKHDLELQLQDDGTTKSDEEDDLTHQPEAKRMKISSNSEEVLTEYADSEMSIQCSTVTTTEGPGAGVIITDAAQTPLDCTGDTQSHDVNLQPTHCLSSNEVIVNVTNLPPVDSTTEQVCDVAEGENISTPLQSGIYKILDSPMTPEGRRKDYMGFVVSQMELSFSPIREASEVPASPADVAAKQSDVVPVDVELPVAASNFLENVKTEVSRCIPGSWLCTVRRSRIFVEFVPTPKATVVQRSVLIGKDGHVSISVHNSPLPNSHEMWGAIPSPELFTSATVRKFSEHVVSVVNSLRKYEICPGNPEGKYSRFSRRVKSMVYDDNKFREGRYLTTFRSTSCQYLIPVSFKRCKLCTKLKKLLDKRVKSASKTSPHPKTNNSKLYTPQAMKKFKVDRKIKRSLNAKVLRRSQKIRELIREKGVHIDDALHEEFTQVFEQNKKSLTEPQSIFLKEQLKYAKQSNGKGMKWHPLCLKLAIQLHSISPSCLDAINDSGIFRLPVARTLFNYTHFHKAQAGPCTVTINTLHEEMLKYQGDEEYKRYHILMMDEMTISSNLVFSKSTGELVGFVDLPPVQQSIIDFQEALNSVDVSDEVNACLVEGLSPLNVSSQSGTNKNKKQKSAQKPKQPGLSSSKPMAKKMLTFMVKGLATSVGHVVASYGVGNLSASDLYHKTWKVIAKLERNKVYVLGVVADGCTVNRKFIKYHTPVTVLKSGVVFDTMNHAAYNGKRRLFFFSDVPHLLKTIRNCFYHSGQGPGYPRTLCLKKEVIVWNTIKRLYNDEKNNTLRLAHKLNKQVVFLNPYSKMNVSYATVVMSRSVANALVRMKYPNIRQTILFIRLVNDFFDCLNGSSSLEGKRKRNRRLKPYTSVKDRRFIHLREFLKYIADWKAEIIAHSATKADKDRALLSKPTMEGIEMTVNAFISATKFMLGHAKAKFIMARAFCQDPLEQYFGRQRASLGGSNNPNKAQFLSTQNKLRIIKKLGFKRRGNTQYIKENLTELSEPLPSLKKARKSRKCLAFGAAKTPLRNSQQSCSL